MDDQKNVFQNTYEAYQGVTGLPVDESAAVKTSTRSVLTSDPLADFPIGYMEEYGQRVPTTEGVDKYNAWDSMKSGFNSTVNITGRSIANLAEFDNTKKVEGYDALEDPFYKDKPDAYKLKYGHLYATSPSPEYSKIIDERVTKFEEYNKISSTNPVAGFIGMMGGGIVDPLTLVSMGGSLLYRSAKLGAQGALFSKEYAAVDPTYRSTTETVAREAALAVVFGNAFHYLGQGAGLFKKSYIDYYKGLEKEPPLTTSGNQGVGADAVKQMSPEDYRVYKSNVVHDALYTAEKNFAADYRLMDSDINTTRKYASSLVDNNNLTIKEVFSDEVRPQAVQELRDVNRAHMYYSVKGGIDEAYQNHRITGGKMGEADFNEAAGRHLLLQDSGDANVVKAAQSFERLYKANWDLFKDLGIINKDAVRPNRGIPFYLDKKVAEGRQVELLADLGDEVDTHLRKRQAAVENKIDELKSKKVSGRGELEIDNELLAEQKKLDQLLESKAEKSLLVDDLYDTMVKASNGKVVVHGNFSASSLKNVSFDFSPEFRAKYGKTNLDDVAKLYSWESSTAKVLQEKFGTQDPLTKIFSEIDDEVRNKRAVIQEDPNLTTTEKNKVLKSLLDSQKKDKEDLLYTVEHILGKAFIDVSNWIKDASSIARLSVSLQTLGNRVIGNISDLAHAQYTHKPIKALANFAHETSGHIIKDVKLMSKGDLKRFGVLIDDVTFAQANRGAVEDIDTPYHTATKGFLDWIFGKYNKLQLFTATQNKLREWTFTNAAIDVIEDATKLAKGTLDPKSAEAIMLRRHGIDKTFAKNILRNVEEHSDIDGSIMKLNLENWDSKTQLEFAASIKRILDNKIVNETPGATPKIMSDPRYAIIFQFQKFIHLASKKIFVPSIQKLKGVHPTLAAKAFGTIGADMLLGVVGGQIKTMMSGKEDQELTPERAIIYALERSAVLAMLGFMSNTLDATLDLGASNLLGEKEYSRYREANTGQLLGPALGQINNAIKIANKARHGDMSTREWLMLKRLAPFNNFFLYNWYLNNLIVENT